MIVIDFERIIERLIDGTVVGAGSAIGTYFAVKGVIKSFEAALEKVRKDRAGSSD